MRNNFTASGLFVTLFAFAALAGGPQPAGADSSIKVLVNDDAITSYDIGQRLKLMTIAREKGGAKEATDQLINESIEVADAKKHGISISDDRVNQAYANIAKGMKMSPDQLTKILGSQGIAADTLKRRIKAQMTWAQVVQAKSRSEVSIKSSDITRALLADNKTDTKETTEYTLQQILFVVPKGSSPAYFAQRKREAESYRLRFAGCDKSIDQAKGLKDVVVRNIGRRTASELGGHDGQEVRDTAVGKTTAPAQVDQGVTLVAVCSTRSINGDSLARSDIENKLMAEQTKGVGDDYLKELRSKAIIQYR
jgi:peptidyl-prolyl cis-trans isomerase SurA